MVVSSMREARAILRVILSLDMLGSSLFRTPLYGASLVLAKLMPAVVLSEAEGFPWLSLCNDEALRCSQGGVG